VNKKDLLEDLEQMKKYVESFQGEDIYILPELEDYDQVILSKNDKDLQDKPDFPILKKEKIKEIVLQSKYDLMDKDFQLNKTKKAIKTNTEEEKILENLQEIKENLNLTHEYDSVIKKIRLYGRRFNKKRR